MRWFAFFVVALFTAVGVHWSVQAGGQKDKKDVGKVEKKDDKNALIVMPPAGGKEVKLVDWRFTQGTRHFSPIGEEKVNPKTKMPTGPEYLEFREEKSTTYKNGIFTLIPLASVRKITYDREKKTVAVAVVTGDAEDLILNGVTRFTGSNKITIEAEALLDGLGAATVKFQGGIDKGLHSVTFPAPTAVAKAKGGAPAIITADDKEKSKHPASDVQPLYLVEGAYRIVPYIMFKKTVKVDMDKVAGIRFVPSEDKKKASNDYEVTLKDGNKHTLTLLSTVETEKKKSMTFLGLLGRVPAGYKLFSVDALYEFRLADEEKK